MVWIGKFKKEDQLVDYTDAGKNIPEIKTNYGVTKEGFIEFKPNVDNKINLDFSDNSLNAGNVESLLPMSETSNTNFSAGGAFDFLDSTSNSSSSSSSMSSSSLSSGGSALYPNYFSPPSSPESFDEPHVKKSLQNFSIALEENSNEIY
ncbi:MAG: hypothetical protein AABX03_01085, partial [Nanoarchaeota archaeon]